MPKISKRHALYMPKISMRTIRQVYHIHFFSINVTLPPHIIHLFEFFAVADYMLFREIILKKTCFSP